MSLTSDTLECILDAQAQSCQSMLERQAQSIADMLEQLLSHLPASLPSSAANVSAVDSVSSSLMPCRTKGNSLTAVGIYTYAFN